MLYIGTGRRGRKGKQLLDDLRETRRHWIFKEEALGRSLSRQCDLVLSFEETVHLSLR